VLAIGAAIELEMRPRMQAERDREGIPGRRPRCRARGEAFVKGRQAIAGSYEHRKPLPKASTW